jgi:hypothetical protein
VRDHGQVLAGDRRRGFDHDRPEEPAPDLLVGLLMRVVPERADLLGHEPVHAPPARPHGVLREPGDAVLRVRHVEPVPVHGDAVGDVGVDERDLQQLALPGPQFGARRDAVEGPGVDALA